MWSVKQKRPESSSKLWQFFHNHFVMHFCSCMLGATLLQKIAFSVATPLLFWRLQGAEFNITTNIFSLGITFTVVLCQEYAISGLGGGRLKPWTERVPPKHSLKRRGRRRDSRAQHRSKASCRRRVTRQGGEVWKPIASFTQRLTLDSFTKQGRFMLGWGALETKEPEDCCVSQTEIYPVQNWSLEMP